MKSLDQIKFRDIKETDNYTVVMNTEEETITCIGNGKEAINLLEDYFGEREEETLEGFLINCERYNKKNTGKVLIFKS